MKKILLMAVLALSSIAATAQVDAFKGNLKEAIQKAKLENKKVMIVASTTWCGPCKALANNVFTTEESGNYINPRFIVLKYNLDINDDDKIADTFGVKAYPTIIFLGSEGKELSRILGGARDAKSFNDRLEEALAPGKTIVERQARFAADKSGLLDHVNFLSNIYMNEEANKLVNEFVATAPVKQSFTPEWIKFYDQSINSMKSPIFETMLNKSTEIAAVMGQEKYDSYMKAKSEKFVYGTLFARKYDQANMTAVLKSVNANPILATDLTKFIEANNAAIVAKDSKKLVAAAKKAMKKMSFDSKMSIINLVGRSIDKEDMTTFMPQVISMYESVAKTEKNPANLESVKKVIDNIKNPKGVPAMRMV